MEFVATKSFVTPLQGFLILPPATPEKKMRLMGCKLDDKPQLYIIGSMKKVSQKITHLELGLKDDTSSDIDSEEMLPKKYLFQKCPQKVVRSPKEKERDQKMMQKPGKHGSEAEILAAPDKIAAKKTVTEKNKLVELYKYPGYSTDELTPLPNGIQLEDILEKVIAAQKKTLIGKTRWAVKMLRKFLNIPCTQAIFLDSFWWQFLHLYHPNREIQGRLFDRIAENYSRILLGCLTGSNREHILTEGCLQSESVIRIIGGSGSFSNCQVPRLVEKFFPTLLSQAVYICFCYCFPRSWFNTAEFKSQICDVFFEWLGGTLHAPGTYNNWDYSQLEPERSRREDLMAKNKEADYSSFDNYEVQSTAGVPPSQLGKKQGAAKKIGNKPVKKTKKPISKKDQQQLSKTERKRHLFQSHPVSHDDQLKEPVKKDAWNKYQTSPKKKLKIVSLPRESHPAYPGPEFTWHHLNINGHCPLIQHFLQKRHAVSKAGCDTYLHRREIRKPIPESAQTYAELIKQSFQSMHRRHKAFTKTLNRHQKEARNFDQQWKEKQEIFRQEMQEELKRRQAPKQKELFPSWPDQLNSSEKISGHIPKSDFHKTY